MSYDHKCTFCGSRTYKLVCSYDRPPLLEMPFKLVEDASYYRELYSCENCGHFYSIHDMDLSGLYDGAYADANYAGNKLRDSFERIISLPAESSDNTLRVKRVTDFIRPYLKAHGSKKTLLDVGSGLAVFSYSMKADGWDVTALDPDPRQSAHARCVAGVRAVQADFMTASALGKFGLISFNKVLEHVSDPILMLRKARECLVPGGICYVELPDGEMAITDPQGPQREEFFIDHLHVFSPQSMALLSRRAGFTVLELKRLREPSSKYTLFMFLTALSE